MNVLMSLYVVLLFVLLTPGVVLSLPTGGNRITCAVVHGVLFAVAWHFTNKAVWRATSQMSGFQDMEEEEEERRMM